MHTNKVSQALIWITLSIVLLLFMEFLPSSLYTSLSLKKPALLAEVFEQEDSLSLVGDKKIKLPKIKQKGSLTKDEKKTFKIGDRLIPIEDYSDDSSQSQLLTKALRDAEEKKSSCNIAFYGDSFIEGDIITLELRDSLQKRFGGKGVGFVPIASQVEGFRRSFPSESDGWKTFSAHKGNKECGISGYSWATAEDASFKSIGRRAAPAIQLCYSLKSAPALFHVLNREDSLRTLQLEVSDSLRMIEFVHPEDRCSGLEVFVPHHPDLSLYGFFYGGSTGVYVDNFSIRGNSGTAINYIQSNHIMQFKALRDHQVIVLQFGLNVANPATTDFSSYVISMTSVVKRLKRLYPQSAILMIGTSDRAYLNEGSYETMPSVPLLIEAQKEIAKKTGVLFWNMYEAMGGENSMVSFVEHKPALANKDYTHLTFEGGRKISNELYKSILHTYKNFKRKNEKIEMVDVR